MSLFCAISGHVPEEPTVNTKTGHLYERRLIEKTIQDTGKDPITGDPLSVDDLLYLKTNKAVKARPSPATSIPGMLNLFQGEWDALMLELHQIRQALSTARQELSYSLYMQDAASRVIARLVRERDAARHLAETAQEALQSAPPAGDLANGKRAPDGDVDMADAKRAKAGITPDIIAAMSALSQQLLQTRKKRAISPTLTPLEAVQSFTLQDNYPLHKTTQGGILAIDTAPDNHNLVATGGSDHAVHIFDREAARVAANLVGHSKKVTDVKFLKSSSSLVSTSADKTSRMWVLSQDSGTYSPTVFSDHSAEVTAVAVHASRDYFVTASLDRTWAFYDAATALCLQQVADPVVEAGYSAASLHPDGLILGTGTQDSLVRIWEVRTQKNVAKFEGHTGPVTSLSFSENGYYLATAAGDGVKLWDLRKLKNFRTLSPYETGVASAVAFDHSGLYLGVAGSDDARVYGSKQDWALLARCPDVPAKGAYSLRWGPDAASLYVGASDHNLRVLGPPAQQAQA